MSGSRPGPDGGELVEVCGDGDDEGVVTGVARLVLCAPDVPAAALPPDRGKNM